MKEFVTEYPMLSVLIGVLLILTVALQIAGLVS